MDKRMSLPMCTYMIARYRKGEFMTIEWKLGD